MRRLAILVSLLPAVALPAQAQDDNTEGRVEIGYRNVDVSGNADKYRQHVNLPDDAFRLFAAELDWAPEDSAVLDRLQLDARNLGGEPHSNSRFRMQKVGVYDLDLRYRTNDYFYRDAGWFFSVEGDPHTWDTRRHFFNGKLDIQATKNIRVRLGGDFNDRDGRSTTTRDVQREVFVLERPVDQQASSYWIGADFRVGWAEISVEQRALNWENRWQLTTADNPGIDGDTANLDDYSQLQTTDAKAPITRLSARGRPLSWFRFSVAYAMAKTELDYDTQGEWRGQDFDGLDFNTTLTNMGRVERDSDLIELDLWFGLLRNLDLIADVSRRNYDQDGTIDSTETQTGGTEGGLYVVQGDLRNELELETYGLTLDWRVSSKLSVAGGVGLQQRTADFPLAGPPVETDRTLYRAGVNWRPSRIFNLRFDAEQGTDDNPYTPVSPTSSDRVRLALHVRPLSSLNISLTVLDRSMENDLSYALGRPTNDTPPANDISLARFDVTSWALSLNWAEGPWDILASYTNADILSDADIVYTIQPVMPFDPQTTRQTSGYTAKQDLVNGHLRYKFGRGWRVGADGFVSDNEGSFPIRWIYYGVDLQYELRMGLYVRLAFERYDYSEDNPYAIAGVPPVAAPGINDYDADLATLYLGYRF
jgi:hypothetical protein